MSGHYDPKRRRAALAAALQNTSQLNHQITKPIELGSASLRNKRRRRVLGHDARRSELQARAQFISPVDTNAIFGAVEVSDPK